MIFPDPRELADRITAVTGRPLFGPVPVRLETTQYMELTGGMVLRLGENDYFITGEAVEGRFGIDDQPKFWVKFAVDLTTGLRKVIKLVFYEDFTSRVGPFLLKGRRSPEKEAHVLELTRANPRFMQGLALLDPAGNLVRVIDFVRGPSLYRRLNELNLPHEQYFHQQFPAVMDEFILDLQAIADLIGLGDHHGDIRPDHIIIDPASGRHVWIDFDFQVNYTDFDVWSLGEVLIFIVGKGFQTHHALAKHPELYAPHALDRLTADDSFLFIGNEIANLRVLFPYLPPKLNRILMSFSTGSSFFYESIPDLITDLHEAIADIKT